MYAEARSLVEFAESTANILQGLPPTFSGTLAVHMQRKGIVAERLAELCMVSTSTIHNLRTGKTTEVSFRMVLSLCVGLQLNLELSRDVLLKAGYVFRNNRRGLLYQRLIEKCYNYSIHDCNALLLLCGEALLGSKER